MVFRCGIRLETACEEQALAHGAVELLLGELPHEAHVHVELAQEHVLLMDDELALHYDAELVLDCVVQEQEPHCDAQDFVQDEPLDYDAVVVRCPFLVEKMELAYDPHLHYLFVDFVRETEEPPVDDFEADG